MSINTEGKILLRRFLFDSNCFITACRFYYPPEIFNSLWNKIFNKFKTENFYTIEEVQKEIKEKADRVAELFQNIPKSKILKPKSIIQCNENFVKICNYIRDNYTNELAINNFSNTDAWLIAYAMTFEDVVIVTYEKWKDSRSEPVIPVICEKFGLSVSNALKQHYDFYLSLENNENLLSYRCTTFTEALFLNNIKI